MTRSQNYYYQDPTGAIGNSLVTAIFGNPEMAAKAAMQRSQMAENDARARLAGAQAQGYEDQHTAGESLPALLAAMNAPNAPLPSLDDPNFAADAAPSGPPPAPDANFRNSLPAVVAALSRMQGDKVDTSETVSTLASFLGGDEMARRGLVAQGHTPGEEFALTPERADAIAQQGYDADQAKSFGVARINHESDIPVANIRARSAFDVATVNNRDDVPVANIAARSRENVAAIKSAAPAPGFDVIQKSFPGLQMNSGWRSAEHNRRVGGVANSDHLGNKPGIQGYDTPVIPGMTPEQAAAKIEADNPGIRVIDARDERGKRGPNGAALGGYHFSLQNVGGVGKAGGNAASAKPINKSALDMIDTEFGRRFAPGSISVTALNVLRSGAIREFQRTGDPVSAVQGAISRNAAETRRKQSVAGAPRVGEVRKGYRFRGGDPADQNSWSKVR